VQLFWQFSDTLLAKSAGRLEGWYAPQRSGHWTIEIAMPKDMAASFKAAEVNGVRSPASRRSHEAIVINGSSAPDKPLRWALS
jgi:hypothetical protein